MYLATCGYSADGRKQRLETLTPSVPVPPVTRAGFQFYDVKRSFSSHLPSGTSVVRAYNYPHTTPIHSGRPHDSFCAPFRASFHWTQILCVSSIYRKQRVLRKKTEKLEKKKTNKKRRPYRCACNIVLFRSVLFFFFSLFWGMYRFYGTVYLFINFLFSLKIPSVPRNVLY